MALQTATASLQTHLHIITKQTDHVCCGILASDISISGQLLLLQFLLMQKTDLCKV